MHPEFAVILHQRVRRRIQERLLAWFARNRRDLPWRDDRDPYRIWVSEVMLQQTQVATVIPYFERFLRTFPNLAALATAPEEEVLRLWEGLGYYRRARDLHRAARMLRNDHGEVLPDDAMVWRQLPGVGRYILGAVLSQAFDRKLPIVEANSQRVLCRLFGWTGDPRTGPVRQALWQAAEHLLPDQQVGDFNQALMELGALVCTTTAPACSSCPVQQDCQARRLGLQASIPPPAPTAPAIAIQEAAVVLRRRKEVLLVQRPARGRWAGLWEFPHGPVPDGETGEAAARRLLAELTGLRGCLRQELTTLRHAVTRYRITMICFEANRPSGRFRSDFYQQARWLLPEQLAALPVSSPQRRLARLLAKDRS